MQIIILGMHRSGTSMITRVINLLGAYLGEPADLIAANEHNPDGYWERWDVLELNARALQSVGADWDSSEQVRADRLAATARAGFDADAKKILDRLNAHPTWVLKDPRMCLTLPLWRPLLRDPVFVIVYRNPLEVARSLATRNRFPIAYSLAMWEAHNVAALEATRGAPRVLVSYNAFMADPARLLGTLRKDLQHAGVTGLDGSDAGSVAFVSQNLHHHKQDDVASTGSYLTVAQTRLYEALKNGEVFKPDFSSKLSAGARETLALYLDVQEKDRRQGARIGQLEEELRGRDAQVAHLASTAQVQSASHARDVENLRAQIEQRDGWVRGLLAVARTLVNSWTWRAGNVLTGWARAIARRRGAACPEDRIEELQKEIDALRDGDR